MLLRIRVGVKRMCVLRLNLVLPLLLSFSFSFCCGTHTLLGPMRWWLFSRKRSKIQIHDYVEMCYTMIQTFICFVSRLVYIYVFHYAWLTCWCYFLFSVCLCAFASVFRLYFSLLCEQRPTTWKNTRHTFASFMLWICAAFLLAKLSDRHERFVCCLGTCADVMCIVCV